jgi:hypothetical protein
MVAMFAFRPAPRHGRALRYRRAVAGRRFSTHSRPRPTMTNRSDQATSTNPDFRGDHRMKALLPLAAMAALLASPVFAACPYPTAPKKVPDGNTATLEEMLAAQKAVKQFDADVGAYQTCLESEHKEAIAKDGDKLKPEDVAKREKDLAQKVAASGEEVQALADRFNTQIKVYKEKNKKKE